MSGRAGRAFSIGGAIGDAFRLMRRHPLAVLAWGAVALLPLLFIVPFFTGFWNEMASASVVGAGELSPETEAAIMSRMMGLQGLSGLANIGQLIGGAVIATATMRASWSDGARDRWAFMRLGMDELRVGLTFLAVFIGLYVLMFIVMLLGMAVGAFAFVLLREEAVWLIAPLILAVLVGFLFGFARIVLIPFASAWFGTFAFSEGWNAGGDGRWLRVAGLMVLTLLISMLITLPFQLAAVAAGFAWFAAQASSLQGATWQVMPRVDEAEVWLWVAVGFLPLATLAGVQHTLAVGALSSAWRRIVEGDA